MDFISIQPISTNGKVLIDEAVYNELKKTYIKARLLADLEKSEKQIADGQYSTSDEVFSKLRAKYGY